ncbi:MAG: hypothetical protein H8E26_12140, partial [FCB group bacterium]|nr:hypothetical protein [FCB group bacterium]
MHNRTFSFRKQITLMAISLMLFLQSCVSVAPPVVAEVPQTPVAPEIPTHIVKSGLEVFIENRNWDHNLKYGLLANQSCVDRNLVHGVQLLPEYINLVLIMSPE